MKKLHSSSFSSFLRLVSVMSLSQVCPEGIERVSDGQGSSFPPKEAWDRRCLSGGMPEGPPGCKVVLFIHGSRRKLRARPI